jgi:hypothetical protein
MEGSIAKIESVFPGVRTILKNEEVFAATLEFASEENILDTELTSLAGAGRSEEEEIQSLGESERLGEDIDTLRGRRRLKRIRRLRGEVEKLKNQKGRELTDEEYAELESALGIDKDREEKVDLNSLQKAIASSPRFLKLFTTGLKDLVTNLSERGSNPADFFSNNTKSLQDLKTMYVIMYIMNGFARQAFKIRSKMSSVVGNFDAAKNTDQMMQQAMEMGENYNVIYKKFNVKNQIERASNEFNGFFVNSVILGQDIATGGKGLAALDAAREMAQSVDVGTGVAREHMIIKTAIRKLLLEELTEKDLNVIVALGSFKGLDMTKVQRMKTSFKNDSVTEPDETNDRILQIYEFLQEEFDKLLDKTINKSTKQLKLFIKKAATNPKVAAIKDDLTSMIQNYEKTIQKFKDLHIKIINNKPEQYKEFLDKLEKYDLGNTIIKIKELLSGATPGETEKPGSPPADPNSLKNLSPGNINKALNQLRQKGISAKDLTNQFTAAIDNLIKGAGPLKRQVEERDVPAINKIKDEIVKILSGDFSNLIKEQKERFKLGLKVHPATYKIIKLISKGKF